jgi:predicted TIM-barrel fold metal-dependent hydrolase
VKFEFFDVNTFLGVPTRDTLNSPASASELLARMDDAGIGKAVAWHIAQHDYDAAEGNRLLSETIAGETRLFGCWSILPPQTGEVIGDDFFSRMKQDRIVALRMFPQAHHYVPDALTFGRFMDQLFERRIPLMLSLTRGFTWESIHGFLKEFPFAHVILCDIGIWGVDRYTWPLLDACPNLYLETSMLSIEDGGVEAAVKRFGAGRFVFGSGFPERYSQAAVLQLLHAEISDADKTRIASGNFVRLVEGIRYE